MPPLPNCTSITRASYQIPEIFLCSARTNALRCLYGQTSISIAVLNRHGGSQYCIATHFSGTQFFLYFFRIYLPASRSYSILMVDEQRVDEQVKGSLLLLSLLLSAYRGSQSRSSVQLSILCSLYVHCRTMACPLEFATQSLHTATRAKILPENLRVEEKKVCYSDEFTCACTQERERDGEKGTT